jgi:hypothetical protein
MHTPPGIQQQTDEAGRVVLILPADLTPVLELGWLVGAVMLVVALLPAALLRSTALAAAGVAGMASATMLLLRRLRVRHRVRLTLADDALLIETHRSRRALPLRDLTAISRDRIGPTSIPALAGLSASDRDWLSKRLLAHARSVQADP